MLTERIGDVYHRVMFEIGLLKGEPNNADKHEKKLRVLTPRLRERLVDCYRQAYEKTLVPRR